jgi:hypothetical protein
MMMSKLMSSPWWVAFGALCFVVGFYEVVGCLIELMAKL